MLIFRADATPALRVIVEVEVGPPRAALCWPDKNLLGSSLRAGYGDPRAVVRTCLAVSDFTIVRTNSSGNPRIT